TVNRLTFVTDNAGRVAFHEPGLMGREVFFTVRSHGYEVRKDGFGIPGVKVTPEPGGCAGSSSSAATSPNGCAGSPARGVTGTRCSWGTRCRWLTPRTPGWWVGRTRSRRSPTRGASTGSGETPRA